MCCKRPHLNLYYMWFRPDRLRGKHWARTAKTLATFEFSPKGWRGQSGQACTATFQQRTYHLSWIYVTHCEPWWSFHFPKEHITPFNHRGGSNPVDRHGRFLGNGGACCGRSLRCVAAADRCRERRSCFRGVQRWSHEPRMAWFYWAKWCQCQFLAGKWNLDGH